MVDTHGSRSRAISLSDGIATVRDAVILILTELVTLVGDRFIEGGFGVELKAALVIVLFAGIKFGWKWWTDTRRVGVL